MAAEDLESVMPTSRRYFSETAYQFPETHSDAIVRVASYHRKDFSRSVIWFAPIEHLFIRSSISTSFHPKSRKVHDDILIALPLELLHDICLRLDIRSVFNLRQTNSRMRQIVDSVSQYQIVVSHGLNLFCALLRTRHAKNISLLHYYQALCTKGCVFCNKFGGFISLLTWKRCCFRCLQEIPQVKVQTWTAVEKRFNLDTAHLFKVTSLETLPGIYSLEEVKHRSRLTLVSVHEVISTLRPEDRVSVESLSSEPVRSRRYNFMASCALPYYNKRTGETEHGISCAGCQYAFENDIIGSRGEDWASEACDMEYTKDGFLAHFRWCEQAQLLWLSSNEGDQLPAKLPEAVRRGGFFNRRG